jgi:hypothetical protein
MQLWNASLCDRIQWGRVRFGSVSAGAASGHGADHDDCDYVAIDSIRAEADFLVNEEPSPENKTCCK